MNTEELIQSVRKARQASSQLALLSGWERNGLLQSFHDELLKQKKQLLEANARDLQKAGDYGLSEAMVERLTLSEKRIEEIAEGAAQLIQLPDPCGRTLKRWTLPNGLDIIRTSVPFGVIAMIYESRPNVTADAAALCLKSGNACVLRGGKEAHFTNEAMTDILHEVLRGAGVEEAAVTSILDPDRSLVHTLLTLRGLIDLVIPRGGAGLIRSVVETSTVPVIETGSGVCHTYVDKDADLAKALPVIVNAKTQRPSVCNAMETLLIHQQIAPECIASVFPALRAKGVEIRGDERVQALDPSVLPAVQEDWSTEYGALILSVSIVDSLEDAIAHIRKYSTGHSECIMSENKETIRKFMNSIDAACVYANASTRFTDGFEFGFGAEIGISTQKLHVRGPVGLEPLVTYKYKIFGNGQIRE